MKVREMRDELARLDPEAELMCLDGFNGGGYAREINFGPVEREITAKDAGECADCDGLVGKAVQVIGYGFY